MRGVWRVMAVIREGGRTASRVQSMELVREAHWTKVTRLVLAAEQALGMTATVRPCVADDATVTSARRPATAG